MLSTIQSAIIHRFYGKIFKEKEGRDPEKEAVNPKSSKANPSLLRQITYETYQTFFTLLHCYFN